MHTSEREEGVPVWCVVGAWIRVGVFLESEMAKL